MLRKILSHLRTCTDSWITRQTGYSGDLPLTRLTAVDTTDQANPQQTES
jgi:hypothetical protein